jgi:cytochrome c oxidase subunit 2
VRLEAGYGAGAGSGPSPLTVPSGPKLPVQVIAQQWKFTFRYPTYGGVETPHLVLPVGKMIEFHVTSLDVIHSFWVRQLGIKADANPDVDNIVFVKPTREMPFEVRCAELCGIWHGAMFDHGHVVSASAFNTWIHQQEVTFAPATKVLPPYSTTYLPEPTRRGE